MSRGDAEPCAALEWSHELLGPAEWALFRRLSVFLGSWTPDAAQQVCADPDGDVLETVGSLVDKSLVRRSAHGEVTEFMALESLREYAAEQPAGSDDLEVTQARHAEYVARSAAAMEARVGAPAETRWWAGPPRRTRRT